MSKLKEFLQNCLVVDFEATGLDHQTAEVIETGVALFQPDDMLDYWIEEGNLYKPHEPISPFISSITNITNRMVEKKPYFEGEHRAEFGKLLDSLPYLVAHNSFYESHMSERLFGTDRSKWICTMRLAKYIYRLDPVENITLPFLRYHLDVPLPDGVVPHRAGTDALITAYVLQSFLETLIERGEIDDTKDIGPQLIALLAKPILYEKMTFGKYKGLPVRQVPIDYWKWLILNAKQVDENAEEYDPDLAATVEMVMNELMDAKN